MLAQFDVARPSATERTEQHCAVCGYGTVLAGSPSRCPTCGSSEWTIQMTVATTDGERVWAFRYASKGKQGSLFFSRDVTTLRRHNPMLRDLSDEARLVVSEPLGEPAGAWNEVPPSSWGGHSAR